MTVGLPLERLGPYRIERLLGRGGMGMVFAGRHEETGEAAAIKVLAPALADSGSFRERFDAEIESLRQLRHPHIVRLYGFGEEQGHLFYAMELVDGHNLQEELAAGRRFSWREVTSIALQVCSALKHAHDHGIVHRDLKPANLLWTRDEQVKLGDFGIAKLFGATLVTQGGVLGTADYMAPEQARGESSGFRCDLYSLGAVMYALLTGRPPHSGKSVAEVLHKLRYEQPVAVGRLAFDIPDELEAIVMQLIEKDPRRRVPTALAVQNRLQSMQHALSVVPAGDERPQAVVPPDVAARDHLAQMPTVAVELDARGRPVDPHLDASIVSPEAPASEPAERPAARTHFTPVAAMPDVRDEPGESPWIRVATILGLSAALALIAMVVLSALAPPSADNLYKTVVRSGDDETSVSPTKIRAAADEFLARFPNDPRAESVRQIQRQLELEQLERQLNWMAQHRRPGHQLTAAQQLYLEAVRLAPQEPHEAARRLQALAALGSRAAEDQSHLRRMGQLAEQRLESLRAQLDETAEQHRELIAAALQRAEYLSADEPAAARDILEGLLALYADRPWAADLTERARRMLGQPTGGTLGRPPEAGSTDDPPAADPT